jgi:hypothetical protein
VHEDEAAALEVEAFEGAEVLLLKPTCCFGSGLVDFGVEGVDVGGAFCKAMARRETRSVDDITDVGGGWR